MGRKQICETVASKFTYDWNNASDTLEVAIKMKMTIKEVKRMAYSLRRRNVKLKHFKSRPHKVARKVKDPTPEEIKERAKQIRSNW
tara:strand:- start:3842 stop:4099 length:258 start_codon:yes stop_codon:yes gene_type:complete